MFRVLFLIAVLFTVGCCGKTEVLPTNQLRPTEGKVVYEGEVVSLRYKPWNSNLLVIMQLKNQPGEKLIVVYNNNHLSVMSQVVVNKRYRFTCNTYSNLEKVEMLE